MLSEVGSSERRGGNEENVILELNKILDNCQLMLQAR